MNNLERDFHQLSIAPRWAVSVSYKADTINAVVQFRDLKRGYVEFDAMWGRGKVRHILHRENYANRLECLAVTIWRKLYAEYVLRTKFDDCDAKQARQARNRGK